MLSVHFVWWQTENCSCKEQSRNFSGLPISRQIKKRWLFSTKLQAICRTKARLLIKILHEHHQWRINYSTNKVQVSYMLIWEQFGYQHFFGLPQSKFPDYINSPTFPYFGPFLWLFTDLSRIPWHYQFSRNSTEVVILIAEAKQKLLHTYTGQRFNAVYSRLSYIGIFSVEKCDECTACKWHVNKLINWKNQWIDQSYQWLFIEWLSLLLSYFFTMENPSRLKKLQKVI